MPIARTPFEVRGAALGRNDLPQVFQGHRERFQSRLSLQSLTLASPTVWAVLQGRKLRFQQTGLSSVLGERRQSMTIIAKATRSPPGTVKDLPIFPLQGVVAFPSVTVPLLIFEARYRVLFNTLLSGANGLEEGLINYESPFCGTRQFGLCWVSNDGSMAKIGTTLHIKEFSRFADGRMSVNNQGIERFKVLRIKEQRPVMIAEVEVLPEDEPDESEVEGLAAEVVQLFSGLLTLNIKMGRVKRVDILSKWGVDEEVLKTQILEGLKPVELSYWIAAIFQENTLHQQTLLQEPLTSERLKQEKEVLSGTVAYLAARHAVELALNPKAEEEQVKAAPESDPPSDSPQDAPPGGTQDASLDAPEDTPQDASQDAPQDAPQNAPQDAPPTSGPD